jgi:hypothetical protein
MPGKAVVLTGVISLLCLSATAQHAYVRPEDQFWKRRVVNRIVLTEKVNKPLVYHETAVYSPSQTYTETQGMISALINGVRAGRIRGYDPQDWDHAYAWPELRARMQTFDQALVAEEAGWEEREPEAATADDWGSEWEMPAIPDTATWREPVVAAYEPELAAYEEVVHVVEDWVFDKVRSSLVHQIDYFEVIWHDPTGTLPEKVLARFKWSEVREQLEQTQWKNRSNDAECRSVAEVFDLRLFRAFPINVGGTPVRTLEEAEIQRQKLIEFEHHLWNY